MRIAVTGTRGTLGSALYRHASAAGHTVLPLNRPDCDITDPASVASAVSSLRPDLVINPAAYTNVDGAESEPDVAMAINGLGPRNLALSCAAAGVPLVH